MNSSTATTVAGVSGTVVLITGASSGIGAALAREYARQGAALVLAARRQDRLRDLAEEIRAVGSDRVAPDRVAPDRVAPDRVAVVSCDVTRDGDLERAKDVALTTFGRLDVVIANAGFGVTAGIDKLTLDDYRRQLETNLFGVLRTVLATRQALVDSGGCLAIIGSIAAMVPTARTSPYSLSKAAVHALAACLWYELGADGVAVCLIAPGFVDSEIRRVDNRGVFRPEYRETVPRWLRMPADRAARKMVRAIGKRRRLTVITGHGKLIAAVQRFLPGLLPPVVRALERHYRRQVESRRRS